MTSGGGLTTIDLTTRTEYVDGAIRTRRTTLLGLLAATPVVTIVSNIAGLAPGVTIAAAAGCVTVAFGLRLVGPGSGRRAAVRLGVHEDQVMFGAETGGDASTDIVYPLSDLRRFELSTAVAAVTLVTPASGDLRVAGIRYVTLDFADGRTFHVALLESDPVAREIMRRLRAAAPTKNPSSTRAERRRASKPKPAPAPSAPAPSGPAHSAGSAPGAGASAPSTSGRTSPAGDAPRPAGTDEPRRDRSEDRPYTERKAASAAADVRLWDAARQVHRRVLSDYARYELEPAMFLRYPGVTDVTRDAVMDFHDALAEAQALATDEYPGDAEFAGHYRDLVEVLRRAWVKCERDGKAAGTSYLPAADSSDLDTAAKLLRHAEGTEHDSEKVAYLRKVQQIIGGLDARGRIHLPMPVVASIERQVRRALESGRPSS